MKNDFVFTQVKEVVMTSEKTVTIITKKLEKDDGSVVWGECFWNIPSLS